MAVFPTLALLVLSAPAFLMAPGSVGSVQLGILEMESIVKTLMRYEHCEEKHGTYIMSQMIILWLVKCKLCFCSAKWFLMLASRSMESIVVRTLIRAITAYHVLHATLELSLLVGAVIKLWQTNR